MLRKITFWAKFCLPKNWFRNLPLLWAVFLGPNHCAILHRKHWQTYTITQTFKSFKGDSVILQLIWQVVIKLCLIGACVDMSKIQIISVTSINALLIKCTLSSCHFKAVISFICPDKAHTYLCNPSAFLHVGGETSPVLPSSFAIITSSFYHAIHQLMPF